MRNTCLIEHAPSLFREIQIDSPRHPSFATIWSWLSGESIPPENARRLLVDKLNSRGWKVRARDFVRGTAASNHPAFILLRMLRGTLSRSDLIHMFFDDRQNKACVHERSENAD